jgi:tetratricopeptide (TPR) repeat protein
MWHLIAQLVSTYASEGDAEKAMETLTKALTLEPQWIPNALFDERTALLRDRADFKTLTTLAPDDAPAHYNAAQVALEYREFDRAYEYLTVTFQLAKLEGSLDYLLEAIREDEVFRPYLNEPRVAALLAAHAG